MIRITIDRIVVHGLPQLSASELRRHVEIAVKEFDSNFAKAAGVSRGLRRNSSDRLCKLYPSERESHALARQIADAIREAIDAR